MQEENTEEVPMKRRKVLRNVHEDDEYNEDGRPAERDTDNVISNIDEQYRTEILRVEEEMVAFFKCNSKSPYICSFTTRKKQSMVTHIKGVHYGIKPFRCNECSFACAYKAKLRGHQMKKHGVTQAQCDGIETSMDEEGEEVFHCPKCDYWEKKIVSVMLHMPWHSKGHLQSRKGK